MEMIYGGAKALLATGVSGFLGVALSETTQVPIGWLIGGVAAVAGGAFYAGMKLQTINSRLDRLEDAVSRLNGAPPKNQTQKR